MLRHDGEQRIIESRSAARGEQLRAVPAYSRYAYGSPSDLGATVTSVAASSSVGTGSGGCCATDFFTLQCGKGLQLQ